MNAMGLVDRDVLLDYTDEDLVALSNMGNKNAEELLFERYYNLIRVKASAYFLIGADQEDIIQEGMIGLFKGIRSYNPQKSSSFRTFAEICIQRQIISAIKSATSQKHNPLNTYISLDSPIHGHENSQTLMESLANTKTEQPEDTVMRREQLGVIEKNIVEMLSELECKVLINYISGKSYIEIAKKLNKQVKTIDNALQRIKKKLERSLEEK